MSTIFHILIQYLPSHISKATSPLSEFYQAGKPLQFIEVKYHQKKKKKKENLDPSEHLFNV